MTTKTLKFSKTNRAAYNPRADLQPGDPEWEQIKASYESFGQVRNFVLNEATGNVVSGHQGIKIMQALGHKEGAFHVINVSEAEEKRLNIILNNPGGKWDESKLATLLAEMQGQSIDLATLGFSKTEIADLLTAAKPKPKQDPDEPAPPSTIAVTKPGDLYELWTGDGSTRHRVMCGDSTRADHMATLMDGQKARLVFIDPPYGVSDESPSGTGNGAIANDNLRGGNLVGFLAKAFERAHEVTIDKAAFYTFYASKTHIEFETAMQEAGWAVKQQLVRAKQMALGRSDYHYAHEPILYGAKTGQNCEWLGDRTETTLFDAAEPPDLDCMSKDELREMLKAITQHSTLWSEKRDAANTYLHPTQKPTSLARRALRNSSLPGEIVIDSFLGSGSTLVGAELEGRVCFGMELDACYIDSAVARFGKTFEHAHCAINGQQIE